MRFVFLQESCRARLSACRFSLYFFRGWRYYLRSVNSALSFYGIVQIAGVHDQAEAEMLIAEGVDWIGFPLCLPVHKEDLSWDEARTLVRALSAHARFVLITYLNAANSILELAEKIGVTTIQIHGEIALAQIKRLKEIKPDLTIIKSLVIRSGNLSLLKDAVLQFADVVDGFITDTFDPVTGASGATGKTHDWSISRTLVQMSTKPVILAGGLTAQNVTDAILTVRPCGVDAHTGVEGPDGHKDRDKVRAFVQAARNAFARVLRN